MKKTIITLFTIIAFHSNFYSQISITNLPKIENLMNFLGSDLKMFESYLGENYQLEMKNVVNKNDTEYIYKTINLNTESTVNISCVVHIKTNQVVEVKFESDTVNLFGQYKAEIELNRFKAGKCQEKTNDNGISCYHGIKEQDDVTDYYTIKFVEKEAEKPSLLKTHMMKFYYSIR